MWRMSRCVTGVPLPGWMFSAFMTTHSLPSRSSTLPLRTELAITFTTVDHSLRLRGDRAAFVPQRRQALLKSAGRFLQAFSRTAKEQRALANACSAKLLVAPRGPRRPPAVPAGARTHQGGAAPLVREAGVRGGGDERAAGVARQRDASRRLRHRADRPGWHTPAALPPPLARIRI